MNEYFNLNDLYLKKLTEANIKFNTASSVAKDIDNTINI